MTNFAINVLRAREAFDMSIAKLAKLSHVSPEIIVEIELGMRDPTPDEIRDIANGLKLDSTFMHHDPLRIWDKSIC